MRLRVRGRYVRGDVACARFRFFFSSRRRHTRYPLVTGVQTCALPITPVMGTIPAPPQDFCILDPVQYTIRVPHNATELKVDLTGMPSLDLFVRIDGYVTASGSSIYANFFSVSDGGDESITVTATPPAALPAGTYYIAVSSCGDGAGSFTLTATVTATGSAPVIDRLAARLDGD